MIPRDPTPVTGEHPIVGLIMDLKEEIAALRVQMDDLQRWVDERNKEQEREDMREELRKELLAELEPPAPDEETPPPEKKKDEHVIAEALVMLAKKWWTWVTVGTAGTGAAAIMGLSGGDDAALDRGNARAPQQSPQEAAPDRAGKAHHLHVPAGGPRGRAAEPVGAAPRATPDLDAGAHR